MNDEDLSEIKSDLKYEKQQLHNIVTKMNIQYEMLQRQINQLYDENTRLRQELIQKNEELKSLEARDYQYMLHQNQVFSRKFKRLEDYAERGEKPLVSVIISVYNTEKYLVQCLESVKNQTLENIEIICIDDGSSDSSRSIIEEYCKSDSRFMLIANNKNQGAGISRNKGLKTAQGKYIICLDSDDFFEPQFLEKMTGYAEQKAADAVICRSDLYYTDTGRYENNNSSINDRVLPEKDVFTFLDMPFYILDFCVGWAWDKLVRRSLITDYDISFQENVRRNEDVVYTCGVMISASAIAILDYKGVHHRKSTNTSLEDTYSEAPDSFYRAGMELLKRLQYQGKAEFLEKSYVNRCLGKSIYYLNQLKNMDIKKYDYIKNMLKAQYFSDMKILKHKNEKDYFYQKKAYEVFLYIMNEK